jgi:hypothetical protein
MCPTEKADTRWHFHKTNYGSKNPKALGSAWGTKPILGKQAFEDLDQWLGSMPNQQTQRNLKC